MATADQPHTRNAGLEEQSVHLPTLDGKPAAEPDLPGGDVVVPVEPTQRIAAVDVLRGFALLGILAMNIVAFAWPFAAYDNPNINAGGSDTTNRLLWAFNHVLFSGKMMTLFSMLFGAGLVLMANRAELRGASIRAVYYRRIAWLIVFGLIHGYLIWSGDILFAYGVCGLLLYPIRTWTPRTLILTGSLLIGISLLAMAGLGLGLGWLENQAQRLEAKTQAGQPLTPDQKDLVQSWNEARVMFRPSPDELRQEIDRFRGSFAEVVRKRVAETAAFQIFYLPTIGIWGIGGRMLLGMGLMKLGVFSAARSRRFYLWMAILGYGVGLPLAVTSALDIWALDFDPIHTMGRGQVLNFFASIPVALGHTAMVMMAVQSGVFRSLQRRLAAVGRMALTNYLAQSLICSLLFYGYGLGLFGSLDRPALWLIVLGIWLLQLTYSPFWLARFRFGPAEWLWRSLTYGRFQALRNPI